MSYTKSDVGHRVVNGKIVELTDTEKQAIADEWNANSAVSTEQKAKEARAKRDRLLTDSDWVTIRATDTGTAVPTEWQTYRQALRDLPQQTGFPENIDWPEKPA